MSGLPGEPWIRERTRSEADTRALPIALRAHAGATGLMTLDEALI